MDGNIWILYRFRNIKSLLIFTTRVVHERRRGKRVLHVAQSALGQSALGSVAPDVLVAATSNQDTQLIALKCGRLYTHSSPTYMFAQATK